MVNKTNLQFKKSFMLLLTFGLLTLTAFSNRQIITTAEEANPVVRILNVETGSGDILLGSSDQVIPPEGYTFTVNVTLDGSAEDLFAYQIGIKFNTTLIRCDAAWIPKNSSNFVTDPNFVFYNKRVQQGGPYINNTLGYVVIGASLVDKTKVATEQNKILCQINFTALKTGAFTLEHIPRATDPLAPLYGLETDLYKLYKNNVISIPSSTASFSGNVLGAPSPPIASFKWTPPNPNATETVTFDASESRDPDGEIVSYYWDFGDGTNATTTNKTITHVYLLKGVYSVNLTVTDNDGKTNSIVNLVPIGGIPYADFTYDWERKDEFPDNPNMNIEVTFNATASYDPDTRTPELPNGNITLYVWNFTLLQFQPENITVRYVPVNVINETTTDTTITQIFTENGLYSVNLTIFDNDGLSNSTTKNVFVGIRPYANFTYSPDPAMPDEEIIFNAYGPDIGDRYTADKDGEIVYAIWDFGDTVGFQAVNTTKNQRLLITSYTYIKQGGIYPVNLTVFDDDGLYTSVMRDVNVTILWRPAEAGLGWEGYAFVGAFFGVIIGLYVYYKKKPEKEPAPKDRYRVI